MSGIVASGLEHNGSSRMALGFNAGGLKDLSRVEAAVPSDAMRSAFGLRTGSFNCSAKFGLHP